MTALPALLLLHGAGDSGECWGPFVQRLRDRPGMGQLEVRTPDAPAHAGRLAGPGRTIAWADLLAEAIGHAEDLVRRTGRPIVAAGHSMGSMTAVGVAANRPDLVAGTFLEDPPLNFPLPSAEDTAPPMPQDLRELGDWFTALRSKSFAEVLAEVRADHPDWDEAEYAPWARAKQAADPAAFADPVLWVHADSPRILRAAPAPVVLVVGRPERGSMVLPAVADELADLPGWSVRRLPAGHDVRRDAPDATATLLADLIRSVAG